MPEDRTSKAYRPLRSITRLLMGGLLLGSEALQERLQIWSGQSQSFGEQGVTEQPEMFSGDLQAPEVLDPLPEQLPPPGLTLPQQRSSRDLRYAMIGLIFEGEEQLEQGLVFSRRVGGAIVRVLNPIIQPISRIPNPTEKGFDKLVKRGQSSVDRWVQRGREEETLSRQLAQEAATNTVDESITYMAHNPAVGELIQTQGVSLAQQILELVRGDAVSADYFFEGLVRYALRRKPRYLLPPPSPEVQAHATWTLKDIRHEDLNGNE